MDITNTELNLDENFSVFDLTTNIKNPKYRLFSLKIDKVVRFLKFNSKLTSFVVVKGELQIENSRLTFKKFEGFHLKNFNEFIGLKGSDDCTVLIGSNENISIEYSNIENFENPEDSITQLSDYTVKKPWGYEIWYTQNTDNTPYALKNIHMEKDFQSSLQSHEFKSETNVVVIGEAKVLFGKEAPKDISLKIDINELDEKIYKPFDGWSNKVNELHRVIAYTTYDAIEISTPELDDVIRWEDDNNRSSGKIDSEHKN